MCWGSNHDEWDDLHSSIILPRDNQARRWQQRNGSGKRKITQMLLVINFILHLLSAVIGVLNSNPKFLYSLILVLLSFASFVLWIIELVHRGKRETVTCKWRGKLIPWPYYSSTNKSFFQRADIVGLLSALFTFIITVVNFVSPLQHANTQIQINPWPIVAAFFSLLCSIFWADRTNKDARNLDPLQSSQGCRNQRCSQINFERVFAILNFILEMPSAVLDQLSSEPKSQYARILMLLSLCSLILCIFEFWGKGKTGVIWSWKWLRGEVRCHRNKLFFSFWDKVGLISAVIQLILTIVNCILVDQHKGQVPICALPIVFALVRSFSKIYNSPNETEGQENFDEEDEVTQIDPRPLISELSSNTESEEERVGPIGNEPELPEPERRFVQVPGETLFQSFLSSLSEDNCWWKELREAMVPNDFIKKEANCRIRKEAERCLDELQIVEKSLKELNENAAKRFSDVPEVKKSLKELNENAAKRFLDVREVKKSLKKLIEGACSRMNSDKKEEHSDIEGSRSTMVEHNWLPETVGEKMFKMMRNRIFKKGNEKIFKEEREALKDVDWMKTVINQMQNGIKIEENKLLIIKKRKEEKMLRTKSSTPISLGLKSRGRGLHSSKNFHHHRRLG